MEQGWQWCFRRQVIGNLVYPLEYVGWDFVNCFSFFLCFDYWVNNSKVINKLIVKNEFDTYLYVQYNKYIEFDAGYTFREIKFNGNVMKNKVYESLNFF